MKEGGVGALALRFNAGDKFAMKHRGVSGQVSEICDPDWLGEMLTSAFDHSSHHLRTQEGRLF